MSGRAHILAAALALSIAAPAHADLQQFVFRWDPNPLKKSDLTAITGSFTGNLNGSRITDLTDIFVFRGGNAFRGNGHLYTAQFNAKTRKWDAGGYFSLDGKENNIILIDSDYAHGNARFYNFIYFVSPIGVSIAQPSFRQNFAARNVAPVAVEMMHSAIPEPSAWALMVLGFGTIGAAARARVRRELARRLA